MIIEENAGDFAIINGEITSSSKLYEVQINKGEYKDNSKMVYGVIRLIDGIPLFYEDHYKRMQLSCKAAFAGITMANLISESEFMRLILKLAKANGKQNCNVKLVVFSNEDKCGIIAYISKSFYPSAQMADTGVRTGIFRMERENPNIKVIDWDYKDRITRIKALKRIFEVLLADRNGNLIEGSASNLFFVKSGKVYTAPGKKVLKGITRKYVIEACKSSGVPLFEKYTTVDELNEVEGIFLSGTSIKVLPVSSIGKRSCQSSAHPVIIEIRNTFDRILSEYIKGRR